MNPMAQHRVPHSIAMIAAVAANRVIGNENRLPWRLPGDLPRVKRLTIGKALIMGRKTHESIGRPLPGRLNIVLTHQADYQAEGCMIVHTVEEALAAAHAYAPHEEIIIFGGADLYRLFLPQANRLYLTLLADAFPGDAIFPEIDWCEWQEVASESFPASQNNPHAHSFGIWERRHS